MDYMAGAQGCTSSELNDSPIVPFQIAFKNAHGTYVATPPIYRCVLMPMRDMIENMEYLHGYQDIPQSVTLETDSWCASDEVSSGPLGNNYGQLPLQDAFDAVKTRNLQVKADAYTYASEVAMETCKPPSDNQPLASSKVTNRHFVPIRVVATQDSGSTTGVAQIDPKTYVWMRTNPTAGISKDDVVPTSTIRSDAIATPPSAKQIHIQPTTDLAEII